MVQEAGLRHDRGGKILGQIAAIVIVTTVTFFADRTFRMLEQTPELVPPQR